MPKEFCHPNENNHSFLGSCEKLAVFRAPWWPQCYLDELLSGSGLGSGVEMYTGSPSWTNACDTKTGHLGVPHQDQKPVIGSVLYHVNTHTHSCSQSESSHRKISWHAVLIFENFNPLIAFCHAEEVALDVGLTLQENKQSLPQKCINHRPGNNFF